MSLVFSTTYPSPGNSVAPSAAYPQGSAKNVTTGAGVDGTPLERQWVDDFLGFVQRLNLEAGTTPSGVADTVLASDYYDSMIAIMAREIGAQGARSFATVAAMVAATDLNVGDVVITEGYLAAGVGGAIYRVVASGTGTADGGQFINLDTHQAQIIPEPMVKSSQFGAVGDGSTDDSTQIQALIDAFKGVRIDTNSKITTKLVFDITGEWQVIIDNDIVLGAITEGLEVAGTNCIIEFTGRGTLAGDSATAAQIGISLLVAGALTQIRTPKITGCLGQGIQIASQANVVSDGNISGATNGAGIYVTGATSAGNKLINCLCSSSGDGIIIESAPYTRIEKPDCTANTGSGIRLQPSASGAGNGAQYTTIVAARCTSNTGAVGSNAGIFVEEDCNFTEIIHPVCNDNTGDGIAVVGIASFEGEHVKIQSPVCDNNTGSGVRSARTKDLELNNGTYINNTIDGIFDTDSIDPKFFGGKSDGNTSNGLRQQSSVRTLHDGMSMSNNGGRGMFLTDGGSLTPETTRTINCDFQLNTGVDWDVSGLTDAKAFRCTGDFVTENGFTTLISPAASSQVITHGISGVPDYISVTRHTATPPGAMLEFAVSNITSTQFTITIIDTSGTPVVLSHTFYWKASLFV